MAVTYATSMKTARMTATRDHVADGTLELCSAGYAAVLAIFGLSGTGGSVSNDVWTLAFDAATVQGQAAAGGGTDATLARIKRSAANGSSIVVTGLTVGDTGSGADIQLSNNNIASGQDVTLTGASVTHAA